MSISENCVPDAVKTARVKLLYKKNSNLDVGNYRPVLFLKYLKKQFMLILKLVWLKTILFMITSLGSEAHSLQILALFIF